MINVVLKNLRILNPRVGIYSILGKRLFTKDHLSLSGETVTLNNQTMYFEKVGTGKHHLFLIPGVLGSAVADFSKQLEKLNRDKFTIVAWDPPGYGKSRPPDRQFPMDFYHQDAKAAAALIKHLGISKFTAIGWSSGGVVALLLAVHYPDLVEKLIMFGIQAKITEKDMRFCQTLRDINKWSEKMKKPMVDMYGEQYLIKTWNAWVDTIMRMIEENEGDICYKELKQVKCPTLILHGKKDAMINRTHPIMIKENIPNSEFIEWEDAYHNLHFQFADRFNETVEKFILN